MRLIPALVLGYLALAANFVEAATSTWNGGGGNVNWSTAGNWTGGAPASAATTDLIFAGTINLGTLATPLNQDIANPMLLNSITFNTGGGAFFLGGNPLRWEGASNTITQSSSSAENIANAFSAPSSNSTFTINLAGSGTGVVTLSGVINSGAGQRNYAIVKSGSSTFSLTGVNTYGGGTTINGGTLIINSASSLGATSGALTLNAGTLEISTGFSTTRSITLGDAASTFQVDPSQTYTVTSAIGGAGALNKTGSGTMVLSGANTFGGGTVVNAGTLQISASERLSNSGTLTVSGGTFDVQTFTETVAGVTLNSGSIIGTGSGTLTGSSYTVKSGSISAILAGTGILTKSTSGTVTLTGANTYSGGTSIAGGTLVLGSSGALGSTGTISFTGGTLQYTSSNTTDYSSRFSNALNQSYSVDTNGQNVTLSSALSSSNGTFAKSGLGTLTLSGTNAYTVGTTINAGTLLTSADANLGATTGALTINAGTLEVATGYSTARGITVANAASTIQVDPSQTFTVSSVIDGTGSLIKTGAGTLTLSGTNTFTGDCFINAGKIIITNNQSLGPQPPSLGSPLYAVHLANGTTLETDVSSFGGNRQLELVSGIATLNVGTGFTQQRNGLVYGAGGFIKAGLGTQILTNANTYSGATTVSTGVLNIQNDTALGTTAAGTTVSSGAALQIQGGITVGVEALTLNGSGVASDGALRNISGTNSYTGALTLGSDSSIASDAGTLTLSGGITNAGFTSTFSGAGNITESGLISGIGALVMNGTGILTLAPSNTYSGGTTINSGTVVVFGGSLGASSSSATINAGTLDIAATVSSGRNFTLGSASSTLLVDPTLTFTSTGIFSGTGALNKTGTGTMIVSGANTYTGVTNVNAGVLNIQNATGLGTTAGGTTVSSGAALQLQGGVVVGAEALTLNGSGVSSDGALRSISGSNSYAGAITLGSDSSITSDAATLTLSGGITNGGFTSTFSGAGNITESGLISGTGALVMNGTGILTLAPSNTYSGGTTINSGTVVVFGGSLGASSSSATINAGTLDIAATVSSGRNFTLGSASSTVMVDPTLTFTSTGVFSGSGALNKTGTGTMSLSGANTYTGSTTISAGTLQVNTNGALGTVLNGTTVANGAALKLNGVNYSTAEALALNGTGIGNTGALTNSGTSTYAGAINIATNATISPGGGTLTLSGGINKNGTTLTFAGGGTVFINTNGITGSSANSDLVVDGTTVVLDTPNSYNGPTTIQNSGTIQLGANNVFPTSPQTALTINTSSVLDMASFSDSVASLAGDSTATVKNSVAGGTSTLTVNPATGVSTTFAGVIAGTNSGAQGNMALVKSGAGTLILTGANTYTGTTTVNAGSLFINGNDSSATGAVTVNNSGSTLGGSGTIGGAVTIASSANLSPGASGTGSTAILHTGALTLSSGSIFNVDLNSTTAGTGYDQVGVTGTVSIAGSNLVITAGSGLSIGDKFFVVLNDGSDAITGTFAQGSSLLASNNGDLFSINYLDNGDGGGTANDISLTVVALPEPSTYIGGVLALAALAYHQRKRRLSS